MTVYSGSTGNGTSYHLATTPNGRAVKSLCGRTIWTGSKPWEPRDGVDHRVCASCAKKASAATP